MNDLSDKEETQIEVKDSKKETSASSELLQKKLESYLLLYYQAYLKRETSIEPAIRLAFLNSVKQDEALAFKVRMLQLDYLNLENVELEGTWDEKEETLFPLQEAETLKQISDERKKTLVSYQETIAQLLRA